jgi:hypothetical protein
MDLVHVMGTVHALEEHPHTTPPTARKHGHRRVAAMEVKFPGLKVSSTNEGVARMSWGTCTRASDDDTVLHMAATPSDGRGPILAEQLNSMPGSKKLCPETVIMSPEKGDVGEALEATGTSDMNIGPEGTG